jgi:hypothetical protein
MTIFRPGQKMKSFNFSVLTKFDDEQLSVDK